MTALSLQHQERLDPAELAAACGAAGMGTRLLNGCSLVEEDPALAFAFRDAVRRVLPGSYCLPIPAHQQAEYGPLRVVFKDAEGLVSFAFAPDVDGKPAKTRLLPRWLGGATETECWARAVVALYRAGLLEASDG